MLWHYLTHKFITGISQNNYKNFFELIVMNDLHSNVGILTYFHLQDQNVIDETKFHQDVVNRHANETLVPTLEDLNTYTKLMYSDFSATEIKGKITLRVLLLAQKIEIKNINSFLFRDNSYNCVAAADKKSIYCIFQFISNYAMSRRILQRIQNIGFRKMRESTCWLAKLQKKLNYFGFKMLTRTRCIQITHSLVIFISWLRMQ